MDRNFERILVTGGAGFIGSAYVRLLLTRSDVEEVVVLDKLTYSGNPANLDEVRSDSRFRFVQGDICNPDIVDETVAGCDAVVSFAAETHVDRSLIEPAGFIQTNVHGTWVLLEAARRHGVSRFVQVSTDEVYGEVLDGRSTENDRLHPRNPYSASKAGAEMLVTSYVETHNLDAVITRGSNTYGAYQYPEKFVPLMITNALERKPLPVYGDGLQVRHWIHVEDHARGIDCALRNGEAGEVYNIGSDEERSNLEVVRSVVDLMDIPRDLIAHVTDRPGHDRRYALSSEKLHSRGWAPERTFEDGLRETIEWYRSRRDWWEPIRDAKFDEYYHANYGHRTAL